MDTLFRPTWDWVERKTRPFRGKKPMNFITIHYLYIIGMTIAGSILLYPAGGLPYVDALFFSAGAATQSGLNTIDVNKLDTYQQIVIYLMAMVTNPIFINTFVVFVRLYWFEKRFQHIVTEAMVWRRSRSRTRADTQGREEKGEKREEKGVNGRKIVVLHGQGKSLGPGMGAQFKERPIEDPIAEGSSSASEAQRRNSWDSGRSQVAPLPQLPPLERPPSFHRNITFADELNSNRSPSSEISTPTQLEPEQHIAFLENQRNPKDKATLRIPGPRESDMGQMPEMVNEEVPENAIGTHAEVPLRRNITPDDARRDHHKLTSPLFKLTSRRTTATNRSRPRTVNEEETAPPARSNTFRSLRQMTSREPEPIPYLSWNPTIGRNSAFIDLTEEQREELGGIEYRSLKTLTLILMGYYFFFHFLGIVCFVPWIHRTQPWTGVVDAVAIDRTWWGFFTSATLFNDLGFTLTPDSMISFQGAVLPLLLGSFLIIFGNTGFPCMLRFIIWIFGKIVPAGYSVYEEIKFLLDHPRRCFTLLFPSSATWVLFAILVALNGIDVILFIILDLNDDAVTSINPVSLRVLNGFFQAASTRTAGTSVVNLANLHPGIQVSYLIMMYISVFPIAISVRRTNVYEEDSLGIYGNPEDEENDKEPSYIGAHLRRQLSFDLWFIFLGLFIIAIAEGGRIEDPLDDAFSMFSILFEIVSAYGTVGLSLGYTNVNTSFAGQFTVVSKLIIIAMMIRGRHRSLPYELDRAILLPSEGLHRREDRDANRRGRRNSNATNMESIRPFATRATMATGRDDGALTRSRSLHTPLSHVASHSSPGRPPNAMHSAHTPRHFHPTREVGSLMAMAADAESAIRPGHQQDHEK